MTTYIVPIMQTTDVEMESVPLPTKTTPVTPDKLIRGTSVKISVPLDVRSPVPARKLVRRDSLDRREAFLKGKEGSRQRRRWENGK